jgi:hypothetical protein
LKTGPETGPVDRQVFDLVPAGYHAARTAAGEDRFRGKIRSFHRLRLKKADRQKRDTGRIGKSGRIDTQGIGILPVQGIMRVLKSTEFQGPGGQFPPVRGKEFVRYCYVRVFGQGIANLGSKMLVLVKIR